MDLQEELEVGKQAEEFLRYTHENLYFRGLLERIKLAYAQSILALHTGQKDEFSILKSKMEAMDDIFNSVSGDIYLGAEALRALDGTPEPRKGIL